MGYMKIELFLDTKSIEKRRYKLAHKYKDIVKKEIDNMLEIGIIYPIDQFEWASPMVAQPMKHDPNKIQVCIDLRWLNRVTLIHSFHKPFVDGIINEVVGH